jgi:hypothetical protein
VASLYRAAGEGRLHLRRLEGRTVVVTASLIGLLSDREKEARAKAIFIACSARIAQRTRSQGMSLVCYFIG